MDDAGVQRYGGDFPGELTHDANFCCDGLVFADRSFKAGSLEAKAAYQPIRTHYDNGILRVDNRLDFTDLNEYTFVMDIQKDGETVSRQEMVLSAPPHHSVEVPVAYETMKCRWGVTLNCLLCRDDAEVARTQHELPCHVTEQVQNQTGAVLTQNGRDIIAEGDAFRYVFSTHYGTFTSLAVNGQEQLADRIRLGVLRAPTDNDRNIQSRWLQFGGWGGENLDVAFTKVYGCRVEGNTIEADCSLAGVSRLPALRYTVRYTIFEDGRIGVELKASIRDSVYWLPRLGFELTLPAENGAFSYYGMGPGENYRDLCHHSRIGAFESTADAEYVPYVHPQEHGNHTRVRELTIGNLTFQGRDAFECAVSRYTALDLFRAKHTDELRSDGRVHLRIDYKMSGVGSNSCGPELVEEHRLKEKEIRFAFDICPANGI